MQGTSASHSHEMVRHVLLEVKHTFLRPGLWHCAMGLCSTAPVAALAPWTACGARLAGPPAWTRFAHGTGAPESRLLPPSEPDSHTGRRRFPMRCWAVVGPDKGSAIIAVMPRSCTEYYLEDAHLSLDTLCAEHCCNVCVSTSTLSQFLPDQEPCCCLCQEQAWGPLL